MSVKKTSGDAVVPCNIHVYGPAHGGICVSNQPLAQARLIIVQMKELKAEKRKDAYETTTLVSEAPFT